MKNPETAWREIPGPWQGEPDREEFRHAGLACLLNRGPLGAWCGYVALPPGHPYHGKKWNEIEDTLQVHGGLTYADSCVGKICHVPAPGEPDDVWWLGFDCIHGRDLAPRMIWSDQEMAKRIPSWPKGMFGVGTYKNIAYARDETKRLAEQLAEIKA